MGTSTANRLAFLRAWETAFKLLFHALLLSSEIFQQHGGTKLTNEELALRAQSGDRENTGQLWEQVKLLTFRFASRFFRKSFMSCQTHGVVLEDLQQECFLAVMDAVKSYDPSRGLKFNSFLSFPLKNHFNALIGHRGNQRADPLNESASLDEPLVGAEDPDLTLMDALEDQTADTQVEVEETAVQKIVREAVKRLNPFHRFLIERHYFQNCTLEAIAQETGMEQREVQKHHNLALNALKKMKDIQNLKAFYVTDHAPRYFSEDPLWAALWESW